MNLKDLGLIIAIILLLALSGAFYKFSHIIITEKPTAWTQDHKADCAVVLTGGRGRVREGFDLLSQKMIRKLILSGVNPKSRLREIFPQWTFYGPLQKDDVILERRSRTTYGNAQQSLPLVEALHCRNLILITSSLHMYRARKIFTSVFPIDFPIYGRAIQAQSFRPRWFDVFIETTKTIFYSLWAY